MKRNQLILNEEIQTPVVYDEPTDEEMVIAIIGTLAIINDYD